MKRKLEIHWEVIEQGSKLYAGGAMVNLDNDRSVVREFLDNWLWNMLRDLRKQGYI
jgi:hypothetical protein